MPTPTPRSRWCRSPATAGGARAPPSCSASTSCSRRATPRQGSIDYELPLGGAATKLRFHLDGNYAQATQAFDQFGTKADESFIVNGRISLADVELGGQRVTFRLWGRNLFDKQYVYRRDPSNSLPGAPTTSVTTGSINNVLGDYGNFNAPRTFGLDASLRF